MELQPCIRCGRKLCVPQGINSTGDPAVSVWIFCQSLGIRPRVKSPSQRGVFCPDCVMCVAHTTFAPEGAFNIMVWEMLRDLIRQTPAFHEISRMRIVTPGARPQLMPGSKPDLTLATPIIEKPSLVAAAG